MSQRLGCTRQCAVDAGMRIERAVAIEAEVDVGIERMIADTQRGRKQSLQTIQMIELRIERAGLFGPGGRFGVLGSVR